MRTHPAFSGGECQPAGEETKAGLPLSSLDPVLRGVGREIEPPSPTSFSAEGRCASTYQPYTLPPASGLCGRPARGPALHRPAL